MAAGGLAIATANLWALARVVAALLPTDAPTDAPAADGTEGPRTGRGPGPRGFAAWSLLAALKMVGLVALVWLLMRRGVVSPLPMLVGFGALPIGIAIGSLVSDRSGR